MKGRQRLREQGPDPIGCCSGRGQNDCKRSVDRASGYLDSPTLYAFRRMPYKIPLFDLNYGPEEEKAVLETIRSKWISTGPKTAALETKFAEMLDSGYAVALSNCTVALHLALTLLDIRDGDEVICPSLTFVATVNPIRYLRAAPVFCDIAGTGDLNLDPLKIESLITRRTRAIVVMHYGGFPCRMDQIMAIAAKHGLRVIEDACHGPLSEFCGKKLGTIGDIGCFSFFSNKNISTGEGGMLVTHDEQCARRAKLLRSHGMTSLSYDRAQGHVTAYDVVELGYNYRMDDIRAALALAQLAKLKDDLAQRARVRRLYLEKLSGLPIAIPFCDHAGPVSNYIFPIVLLDSDAPRRDAVRQTMQEDGIQTSVHYPAVHRFSIYASADTRLPVTDYVTDNLISLPMFGALSEDAVDQIVESLKRGLAAHA